MDQGEMEIVIFDGIDLTLMVHRAENAMLLKRADRYADQHPGKSMFDLTLRETLRFDVSDGSPFCGNLRPKVEPNATLGDLIRLGEVIELDGCRFYPVASVDPDIQARYRQLRDEGATHKWADMIANRAFPGIRTDTIFNEGKFGGATSDHCHPHELWLRKQAEQAGVSTAGKWYCSGLASYSGDPTAWIDSRSDVARVAREKGLKVEGYVNYSPPETAPLERVAIDPEIVHRETREWCAAEPGLDYEATYHHVADLRSGKIEIKKPVPVVPMPDIAEE